MSEQKQPTPAEIIHEAPLQHEVFVEAPSRRFSELSAEDKLNLARDTGRVAAAFMRTQSERVKLQEDELNTDRLTGLGNERKLLSSLENLTAKEDKKETSSLGLLMFDLDGFKAINDNLGHDFGDKVLARIGGKLPSIVRETDLPSYMGYAGSSKDEEEQSQAARKHGDEFFVITPDLEDTRNGGSKLTPEQRHAKLAERVRTELVEDVMDSELGDSLRSAGLSFDISAGTVIYQPGQGVDKFIKASDEAMYAVKKQKKAENNQP